MMAKHDWAEGLNDAGLEPDELHSVAEALTLIASVGVPRPTAAEAASLVRMLERELASQRTPRVRIAQQLIADLATARAQLLIFPLDLWIASAVVMLIGVGLIALGLDPSRSLIFYLVGPLLAYIGMQGAFSSASARAAELELATPISPRRLTLARLVVMLGYQVAVGVVLSMFLWLSEGGALLALTSTWLMPLLLASGLTLILSVKVPVYRAAAIVYAAWMLVVLAGWRLHGPDISVGLPIEAAMGAAGLILMSTALVLITPANLLSRPTVSMS
jgi:hypothetical protein